VKSRVYLPAVLSGVLLWTAFFPLDLGPVAWVALVPFLTLVRADGVGPWRRYFAAFLGGMVCSLLSLQWLRAAHPMMELFAWPALSTFCAMYWPLALLLLRKLDRHGVPLPASVPVVWVALEYVRAHFPVGYPFLTAVGVHQFTGFAWYFLGYTQHHVEPLVQAADLGGVYLVSAAVAAVNGALAELAGRSAWARRLVRGPKPTGSSAGAAWRLAGALALPLGLVAYGGARLAHPPFETGPRVAALQGNLSQSVKMQKSDDQQTQTPLEEEYLGLARQAARPHDGGPAPDLIVWPETCFGEDWLTALSDVPDDPAVKDFRPRLGQYQKEIGKRASDLTRTNALIGLNVQEWDGRTWRRYNSAVLIDPAGGYADRYDKIHLVPFGEYVPFRQTFPWMQTLTPYTHDYSCTPGERFTRFEFTAPSDGKRYSFGMLICYEDSDPYLARQYNPSSGRTAGVDFLVNTSNDGWFDGTEEHEQHLAICRFRAVEARRTVVRAVNMGVSAVIDPDGRVVALPVAESWSKSKKTRGIVRADVPLDRRESPYAAVGDWVPALCWGLLVVGLVARRAGVGPKEGVASGPG
jgi:apolipoprotein N-acyltransferase